MKVYSFQVDAHMYIVTYTYILNTHIGTINPLIFGIKLLSYSQFMESVHCPLYLLSYYIMFLLIRSIEINDNLF